MKIKKNKKEKSTPENVQSIREKKKNLFTYSDEIQIEAICENTCSKIFEHIVVFSPTHCHRCLLHNQHLCRYI